MNIKFDCIETDRLILRKYRLGDIDDYIEFRSNPKVYEYMISGIKTSRDEYMESLKKIVYGYRKKEPTIKWAVELKSEHKLIGSASIEHLYPKHDRCELGWSLNPDYQGKGYATEFAIAVINYIFTSSDIHRLHGFIWKGNEASRKLIERLGFRYEGTNIEARKKGDKYYDVDNFGLLRQDWERLDIYKK